MSIRRRIFLATLVMTFASLGWSADLAKGQEAYNSGDYQTALTEWQPLAEEGNADGQFGMALLYANGFGVSLDDDQALKWYRLAADQGHAEAQCNLAVMHANGWGVPQSDEEAFKWYSLAAEQGVTPAQISLGLMHSSGYGAPQDNMQAYKWFAVAAELGDTNAPMKRDEFGARMSAEEISEATGLASAWVQTHPDLRANR